jgi:hypothetical protein
MDTSHFVGKKNFLGIGHELLKLGVIVSVYVLGMLSFKSGEQILIQGEQWIKAVTKTLKRSWEIGEEAKQSDACI